MTANLTVYADKVTILDGAWGTELQKRGLRPGVCPDAWNLQNPPAVSAVAEAYVQAGAQVILSNTFRSNRLALADAGLADKANDLAERGVAISRRAAGQDVRVFASMGPSGKILMMGEIPPDEVYRAFAAQAAALERGGADAILCESFFELDEILLAAKAARDNTRLPLVTSMTFEVKDGKVATIMGATPADLVAAARKAGVAAVGGNCGAGPESYVEIAGAFRRATDLPIWIKPNAWLPAVSADGQTSFPMGPAEFARIAPALVQAGANFLGGCCGTTPEHIRQLRAAVAGLK